MQSGTSVCPACIFGASVFIAWTEACHAPSTPERNKCCLKVIWIHASPSRPNQCVHQVDVASETAAVYLAPADGAGLTARLHGAEQVFAQSHCSCKVTPMAVKHVRLQSFQSHQLLLLRSSRSSQPSHCSASRCLVSWVRGQHLSNCTRDMAGDLCLHKSCRCMA